VVNRRKKPIISICQGIKHNTLKFSKTKWTGGSKKMSTDIATTDEIYYG